MLILAPKRGPLAVDTEGTGVFHFLGDRPFAWSTASEELALGFGRAPVDPFSREPAWSGLGGPWAALEDQKRTKIFHNAMHDKRAFEVIGKVVRGRIEDTMLMSRVLFSAKNAGLKELGVDWLGVPKDDESELIEATQAARDEAKKKGWKIADDSGRWGDKPHKADFWLAPFEILERYSRLDAERTMLLFHLLNPLLDEDPRLRRKYEEELELFVAVYEMQTHGVLCRNDVCRLEVCKAKMVEKAHYRKVVEEMRRGGYTVINSKIPKKDRLADGRTHLINVGSGKQLQDLVYRQMKFPIKMYTKKGNPSSDAEALRGMTIPGFDEKGQPTQILPPILREIIETKRANKGIEFFEKYLMHSPNNIMHADFIQMGARTTRFACRNPNLQNVPNFRNAGAISLLIQARTPFGPRPGNIWLHPDWQQIEMWIFGAEAHDLNLIADLATHSIHTATANRILGKGRDIVAEELADGGRSNARTRAKMINFGVVFGMMAKALAADLGCSKREAQDHLDLYYEGYHRIRPFMDELSSKAGLEGFVWNRFGRRLQVEPAFAYRAVNYLIQSSCADYLKQKMRWLHTWIKQHPEVGARMVLTIHDEIVIEAPERAIMPHIKAIKKEMEDHHGIWPEIPCLPADIGITRESWDKKEKLEIK